MKKSLIALAVLAAAGVAQAQSNVQLYGIMDLWLGSVKADPASAKPKSQTKLDSGGVSTSRWGLKGSEDLGGGLKANFLLEQGFNSDSGTAKGTNQAFARQSYVGLSGSFGEVKLGKPWTAMDDVFGASNSAFDSGLSATNGVWVSGALYSGNPGNTLYYATPDFGGFSAAVSYSLDESAAAKTDIVDFHVKFAQGPIAAAFAYQVQKNFSAPDDLKITTINGSYDLGVAKLLASYAQSKSGSAKFNEYQIGADVPLSSNLTLSGGYAYSKGNADGEILTTDTDAHDFGMFSGRKRSGFGVALNYSLSKRTSVYGGVSSAKGENTAGTDVSKRSLYAVGLRHTF